MIEVGIKAAAIFQIRPKLPQTFFQYRMTTDKMAPNWIEISKLFKNSEVGILNSSPVKIK